MIKNILLSLIGFSSLTLVAQDTFSIVAVDTLTGEVGSAGASCVDLTNFPNYTDHFLGVLFPAVGAINTQAAYDVDNQSLATDRMNAGDLPTEIIQYMMNNDVSNSPQSRQYGVVRLTNQGALSAGFTGTDCFDYKNHITGPNYSIQGNILLGQSVLDSMEAQFNRAEGDLACKLMAALQGAKVVGADTRCTSNGTSSLFAFVKVAQPTDSFGSPSFIRSLRTANGSGIEPIDSLQSIFNHSCILGIEDSKEMDSHFSISPNPTKGKIEIVSKSNNKESCQLRICDTQGKTLFEKSFTTHIEIDLANWSSGMYWIGISTNEYHLSQKIILE